jgi:cytoskeleton protein RodZ
MSVGSELSAARTKAGLTLENVAERTMIRRTVIERMEADDFSLCGGDVYARGHLRTIATVVGADPQPLVDEFDRLHAPHGPSASEVFEAETGVKREARGPNWTAAMAAAVVVVALIAVFQVVRSSGSSAPAAGPSGSSSTGVGASSPPGASPTAASSAPAASPSPTVVAQVPPSAQGVSVRIEVVSGKTWVSATGSGKKLFEGLLSAGTVKVLNDAKMVKLLVGNAAALRLTVNGVDIGSPGGVGQVVRLSFGPGDPTASG